MYIQSDHRVLTIECYQIDDKTITPPENIAEKIIKAGKKDMFGYYQVKNIDDCIEQAVKWESEDKNRTVLTTIWNKKRRCYE